MSNLVQEIQNDIVNPQIHLSDVLRKAKVLSFKLKNQEFKEWITYELDGYRNADTLPQYRQVTAGNIGDFVNMAYRISNSPIPLSHLPDEIQELFTHPLPIIEGIRWIESRAKSGEDTNFNWPDGIKEIYSTTLQGGYQCLSARRVVNASQMEQIIDTVQNKLLDFVLELEERHPEIIHSFEAISNIPKEEVKNIFDMKITGGVHGSNIAVGGSTISNSSASIIEGATGSEILQLLQQARESVASLPPQERQEATELVEAIEGEVVGENKSAAKLKAYGKALVPLLEKVASGLVVEGIKTHLGL